MKVSYKPGKLPECTLDDPSGCPYCFDPNFKESDRRTCNYPRPVECFYNKNHYINKEKTK